MNILIQHEPRSIALRGAGTNPFALVFRHASRQEDTGDRCVVEFLPWKDVGERAEYKLLNSVEVYGSLGLIDIAEGTEEGMAFVLICRCLYLCYHESPASRDDSTWGDR